MDERHTSSTHVWPDTHDKDGNPVWPHTHDKDGNPVWPKPVTDNERAEQARRDAEHLRNMEKDNDNNDKNGTPLRSVHSHSVVAE